MRVALFSDVHGNFTALEAVLDELDRKGPFDVVVCAGDLVYIGPSPDYVVERLRGSNVVCLRGNCEGIVTEQISPESPPNPVARRSLQEHKTWTVAHLTLEQMQWLANLPLEHRISTPGAKGTHDDLLVVHATPRSFHDDASLCGPQLDADKAREVFGKAGANTVAFGHRHGHFIRTCADLTLVNVSSVSITPDGMPTAAYTVATWYGNHWAFEQHRVAYDPGPELSRARERAMPHHPWWQTLANRSS